MSIRYTHTNIVSENWQKLVTFYQDVFNCIPVPPERNLSGNWLDEATGVHKASLQGMHLRLPGHGDNGPTLEIYQFETMAESPTTAANRKGFAHIAFHVDDVAKIRQKVLDNGGADLGKITEKVVEGVGKLTFIYMTDPEGNIVEIQNWS